jgi:UDP-N-acetylmuramate dehydrogenase
VAIVSTPRTLADSTTLRIGGPAAAWVVARTESELVLAITQADAEGIPVLLLGGGSNLLVSDEGFPGTVVEIATRGLAADTDESGATVTLAAGEDWDSVLAHLVTRGWAGVEALGGIPGRAGATAIQNVGAYGQEVSQVVHSVRVLDRTTGAVRRLDNAACGFGYRTSVFKRDPARWVVLSVSMRLISGGRGIVRYAELAQEMGISVGDEASLADIRAAVLVLRGRKGMVLDEADHDTWSAGSFFTNPIVAQEVADTIPAACPRYPAVDGVKLSAAWLIENAGIAKGYAVAADSRAAISGKHTLALTNRGGAQATDILELANAVTARVQEAFGIELDIEPTLVGLER